MSMRSNLPPDVDALIAGGGPAGAATAIRLASAGWRVALVESRRFPRRKVCGECIAASNLPLLDALGVGDLLRTRGGPALRRVEWLRGDAVVRAALPRAASPLPAWGRTLDRATLDAALVARARERGVDVLQPVALEAFDGGAGDWRCTLRAVGDGGARQVVRAAVAIDAHGSWQPLGARDDARDDVRNDPRRVRDTVDDRRRPGDLFAFKANFVDTSIAPGTIAVLALDGGYGGMVREHDGVATLACCVRRDRLAALRAAEPGAGAGEAVEAWLEIGRAHV